jgi:hypothetical protein
MPCASLKVLIARGRNSAGTIMESAHSGEFLHKLISIWETFGSKEGAYIDNCIFSHACCA